MGVECVERQVLGSSCTRRGRGVDHVFDAHGLSTRKSISRPRYLINSVTRSSVYDEGLDVELLRNTLVGCLVLAVVVVVEVAGAGKRTRESYEGDSKRYAALAVTVREPSTRSWHPPIARISTA